MRVFSSLSVGSLRVTRQPNPRNGILLAAFIRGNGCNNYKRHTRTNTVTSQTVIAALGFDEFAALRTFAVPAERNLARQAWI
jgi:hypothetical protein